MGKDPNSSTGKLVMDADGLRAFIDNRVIPFKDSLSKIQLDDPALGYTLATLLGDSDITTTEQYDAYETGKPLAIGFMNQEGVLGDKGKELSEGLVKAIQSIIEVYEEQYALFDDIVDNMESTLTKLKDTQGGNLVQLDGQEFLDIFEDTIDDLTTTGGKNNSENEDNE
ncbi:type VII secretion system-associated protein [Streptomyces sp. NPDC007084]|uniref:type VII secretion system-associated protein n=1 Tax=Streptomyces sp. NPDC007084 TaxID=3154313 RepID=UPI00345219F2